MRCRSAEVSCVRFMRNESNGASQGEQHAISPGTTVRRRERHAWRASLSPRTMSQPQSPLPQAQDIISGRRQGAANSLSGGGEFVCRAAAKAASWPTL